MLTMAMSAASRMSPMISGRDIVQSPTLAFNASLFGLVFVSSGRWPRAALDRAALRILSNAFIDDWA
jgi:hypothetical protein